MRLSETAMSIIATVQNGYVRLPKDLDLPDGTEMEIVVHESAVNVASQAGPVRLPTFGNGGLQPGINLDNSRDLRRLLDESGRLSQLP